MRKNTRDMIKSIIVLSVISVISGILLSVVFQYTKITDEELQRRISAKLASIYTPIEGYESLEFDTAQNPSVSGFYRAKNEDYFIILSSGQGYGGTLQMYVSFSGKSIVKITPGKNSDTPGIREKALSEGYLSQYCVEITNAVFSFGEEGDFDKAAGATYTSNGVLAAVKNAVSLYKFFLEGKTVDEVMLEKLDGLYPEGANWEKIDFEADGVTGMYRADGGYFAVIGNGSGWRGNNIELYVLVKEYKIEKIMLGVHSDTATIPNVGENLALKDEHLEQYYNIDFTNLAFDVSESGNIDAAAGATRSTNGINEAVNKAVNAYKGYMGRA